MSKINLTLTKENFIENNDIKVIRIYENDYYKIREDVYNLGFKTVTCEKKDKYTPWISVNVNLYEDCEIESFSIDTCSYGLLNQEEIKKVINGYNMALKTVEQLEEMYVRDK